MTDESIPTAVVGERTETGLLILGILAGVAAAYYTGQTGNWGPLILISGGILVVVLFVTAES